MHKRYASKGNTIQRVVYSNLSIVTPKGVSPPALCDARATRESQNKLENTPPQLKSSVTSKSPVGGISAVTLIGKDTTLDHTQKAKKVYYS